MCFKTQVKTHLSRIASGVLSLCIGAPIAYSLMKNAAPPGFNYGAALFFALLSLVGGYVVLRFGIFGVRNLFRAPDRRNPELKAAAENNRAR